MNTAIWIDQSDFGNPDPAQLPGTQGQTATGCLLIVKQLRKEAYHSPECRRQSGSDGGRLAQGPWATKRTRRMPRRALQVRPARTYETTRVN